MTKRNSTSYVTTLDAKSAVDMEILQSIKKAVKVINFKNPKKRRVVLRGRKPEVKAQVPNGWIHKGSCGLVSYNRFGNIVGGIKNATMYDVYIYDRRD